MTKKKELLGMNFFLSVVFLLLIGFLLGYFFRYLPTSRSIHEDIGSMDIEGIRDLYTRIRTRGIEEAKKIGMYDCCIEPACTMCFDHGKNHQWTSNNKYCNCDKLLEEGKDPCPQCRTGLAEGKGRIR